MTFPTRPLRSAGVSTCSLRKRGKCQGTRTPQQKRIDYRACEGTETPSKNTPNSRDSHDRLKGRNVSAVIHSWCGGHGDKILASSRNPGAPRWRPQQALFRHHGRLVAAHGEIWARLGSA